jgi:hypothetical protein
MDPGCRLPLTISIPMERAMAPWIRRGAPASSFIAHCPLCFTSYNGGNQGRKVPDLWRPLIVHVETAIKGTDDPHVRLDPTGSRRLGCAGELLLSDGGWIELTRA